MSHLSVAIDYVLSIDRLGVPMISELYETMLDRSDEGYYHRHQEKELLRQRITIRVTKQKLDGFISDSDFFSNICGLNKNNLSLFGHPDEVIHG